MARNMATSAGRSASSLRGSLRAQEGALAPAGQTAGFGSREKVSEYVITLGAWSPSVFQLLRRLREIRRSDFRRRVRQTRENQPHRDDEFASTAGDQARQTMRWV